LSLADAAEATRLACRLRQALEATQ
jgi:hypothetical protein